MRKLEIRIWDGKEYHYLNRNYDLQIQEGKFWLYTANEVGGHFITSSDKGGVLEFYINKTDINGNKIFEGDISKHCFKPLGCLPNVHYYYYRQFFFSNQGVGVKIVAKGRYSTNVSDQEKKTDPFYKEYHRIPKNEEPIIYSTIGIGQNDDEIIGNIHENPELLKK